MYAFVCDASVETSGCLDLCFLSKCATLLLMLCSLSEEIGKINYILIVCLSLPCSETKEMIKACISFHPVWLMTVSEAVVL